MSEEQVALDNSQTPPTPEAPARRIGFSPLALQWIRAIQDADKSATNMFADLSKVRPISEEWYNRGVMNIRAGFSELAKSVALNVDLDEWDKLVAEAAVKAAEAAAQEEVKSE